MEQEELEELVRKEESEIYKMRDAMKALLANEYYQMVVEKINAQIDARIHETLVMPVSQDDLVKKTYAMGEIAGLKIAINYPKIALEGIETHIQMSKMKEQAEQGNGNETTMEEDMTNG